MSAIGIAFSTESFAEVDVAGMEQLASSSPTGKKAGMMRMSMFRSVPWQGLLRGPHP